MSEKEKTEFQVKLKQVLDNVKEIHDTFELNPYDVFEFIWEESCTDIEALLEELGD